MIWECGIDERRIQDRRVRYVCLVVLSAVKLGNESAEVDDDVAISRHHVVMPHQRPDPAGFARLTAAGHVATFIIFTLFGRQVFAVLDPPMA